MDKRVETRDERYRRHVREKEGLERADRDMGDVGMNSEGEEFVGFEERSREGSVRSTSRKETVNEDVPSDDIRTMLASMMVQISTSSRELNEKISTSSRELNEKINERISTGSREVNEKISQSARETRESLREAFSRELEQATSKWDINLRNTDERLTGEIKEVRESVEEQQGKMDKLENRMAHQEQNASEIVQAYIRNANEIRKDVEKNHQEIVDLREDLEDGRWKTNIRVGHSDYRVPDEKKFCGQPTKAVKFLKDVKQDLGRKISNWEQAKVTLRTYLVGTASEWYETCEDEMESFEQFEVQFKRRFWSSVIQNNYRRELEVGTYDPNGRLNPVEYLISKYKLAKQLDTHISEEQFVLTISRHFDGFVQDARMCGAITTIDRMQDLLDARHANTTRFRQDQRPTYNRYNDHQQRGAYNRQANAYHQQPFNKPERFPNKPFHTKN